MCIDVKVKKLRADAVIPKYATEGSAASDLCYAGDGPVEILPGTVAMIPTGLAISMGRRDVAAFIYARSGLASKRGIAPANCVGVIDSDYRGEVKVPLINHSSEPYTIRNGDRIAQLVVMPVIDTDFVEADELSETQRGSGGFGSTGK